MIGFSVKEIQRNISLLDKPTPAIYIFFKFYLILIQAILNENHKSYVEGLMLRKTNTPKFTTRSGCF